MGDFSSVVAYAQCYESELAVLELDNFCQSRDSETDHRATVWDWCAKGDHIERVDIRKLDNKCYSLLRSYLEDEGFDLPELGTEENDAVALCALVPADVQLSIWKELRKIF